jgi:hypothetical protein
MMTADEQVNARLAAWAGAQPGDLVFFAEADGTPQRPGPSRHPYPPRIHDRSAGIRATRDVG